MRPSSRTPEGQPNWCPVCGHEVCIEPSMPPGDAPCPRCGCLLWFPSASPAGLDGATEGGERCAATPAPPVIAAERQAVSSDADLPVIWAVCGAVSALGIGLIDGSVAGAALWLAGSLAFAWLGVPRLVWLAKRVSAAHRCFWCEVVFGWGFVPGPVAGCFVGLLPPLLWGWPGTALQSCLLGFLLGPLFAAVEGLSIAGLLVGGIWLVNGKRPDLH